MYFRSLIPPKRGISLVEMVVILAIIAVLAGVLFVSILHTRAASRSLACSNNLRQVGAAMASYESTYRVFPPACDLKGFSLQVSLLPLLERADAYASFRAFSYDNEGSIEEMRKLPRSHGLSVYRCPDSAIGPFRREASTADDDPINSVLGKSELDFTSYLACFGSKTALPDIEYAGICSILPLRPRTRVAEVRNGLSQTLAVCEGAGFDLARLENILDEQFTGYAKGIVYQTAKRYHDPDELANDCWHGVGTTAVPKVVGYEWVRAGSDNNFSTWLPPNSRSCLNQRGPRRAPISASSHHGSFVNACYGDGSVRKIDDSIESTVWQNMGRISQQAD